MQDPFDTLSRILNDRYSCRAYLKQEVDRQTIQQVVAAASRVPTWCNAQPWQVLVTRGAATAQLADKLVKAATTTRMTPDFEWPIEYTGAFRDRRRTCGYQLYEALGIDRDDMAGRSRQMLENFRFFGAPHVAIVTSEANLGPYGSMDCGGFIAAFTLAAQAKGLASVVQASVAGYAPVVRSHFDIPDNRLVQAAIAFGHADPDHPANGFRTDRAPVEEVVTIFE